MYMGAYSALFLSSMLSGVLLFVVGRKERILKYVSIFGASFLFAVCFVHMLPEALGHSFHAHAHVHGGGLSAGMFVLLGFLLQLFLEFISKGAEHGHLHDDNRRFSHNEYLSALMMLLGVCIHAFLEGFAFVSDGRFNYSLLSGVIIHNIPISMIIVASFMKVCTSRFMPFVYLAVFAMMGVLGSLFASSLAFLQDCQPYVLCFVVGILMHVSITTLFDSSESHQYNFIRFTIVVAAFALVCLLPH